MQVNSSKQRLRYQALGIIILLLVTAFLPIAVNAEELSTDKAPQTMYERGLSSIGFPTDPRETTPRPQVSLLADYEIYTPSTELSTELYNNFLGCDPEMFLYNENGIKGLNWSWDYPTDEEYSWLKALAAEITEDCDTAEEKIYAVSEYIALNICYDFDYYYDRKSDVYLDPYDVLTNGSTVCEGYARTTSMLLQLVDVPCVFVDSPNHKWNMAYNGERWMLIDTTWMARGTLNNGVLTKYEDISLDWYDFTIDDANGQENHIIDELAYAVSGGELTVFPCYTAQSDVVINSSVSVIKANITKDGGSIKTVSLPETLTSVGSFSFQGSLDTVYYEGSAAEYQKISVSSYNPALTGCGNIIYRDNAIAPYVVSHPQDTLAALDVSVTLNADIASNSKNVSYQWYKCSTRTSAEGTPIDGAVSESYTFTPDELGKSYYYLEATVTDSTVSGAKSVSVKTIPCEVYVFEEIPSESGRIGGSVEYYVLSDSAYIEGNGAIENITSYIGFHNKTIHIGAGITYISEEFITKRLDIASGFVVDSENPRYESDSFGALYDMQEKKLLSLPYYIDSTDFAILEGTETIIENAIYPYELNSLTIPASLKTIEGGFEAKCKSIILDENNTSFCLDEYGALIDIAGKRVVKYPAESEAQEYIMSDDIVSVEDYAFYQALIYSIELSDNLESIGEYAFRNSRLAKVVFPKSLISIGENAFRACYNLQDVYFLGDVPETWGMDAFIPYGDYEPVRIHYAEDAKNWTTPTWTDVNGMEFIATPFDRELFESGFACGDYAKWTISGDTLTISGSGEMWDFPYGTSAPWQEYENFIRKVVVKRGITSIGARAFRYMYLINEVELPITLTKIGETAFRSLGSLRSITIPENVNEIGANAFYNCYNLSEIRFRGDVPTIWGDEAFVILDNDAIIYYPEGKSDWDTPTWTATDGNVYNTLPYTPEVNGYNISGTVTAYGSDSDEITVSLIDSEGDKLEAVESYNGSYTIEAVEAGTYTLVFSKAGHFTAESSVTITDSDITVDAALELIGDVNGDSVFDDNDTLLIAKYFAGHNVELSTDSADVDGDGAFTRKDAMILSRNLAGWEDYSLPYNEK